MDSRFLAAARRYPLPAFTTGGLILGTLLEYVLSRPVAGSAVLLLTLIVAGTPTVLQTIVGMLRGRFASDIVASLAIVAAAATGELFAGCVIVLMQTGGEALEAFAKRRASASLEALLKRAPRLAHRRSDGGVEDVPVEEVRTEDRLLVRPGEVIPVDAVVVSGVSSVDESALTGEPIPETAREGSELMSGSVCMDGALEVRALRPSAESQYEQIVRLVEQAEAEKAPIGRLADRYAVVFTPLTLLVCGLTYAFTQNPETVVAVLVVATPCPLILATPVAIISGIGRAAARGIIVKHGSALELIGQVRAALFDKTGTLTRGKPRVDRLVPLDHWSSKDVLRLSGGLEQHSSHPMAQALVERAQETNKRLPTPETLKEIAGQGVVGRIEGHEVSVGSVGYAVEWGIASVATVTEARREAGAQHSAVAVVGIDGEATALVVYDDPVRSEVPRLIERLKSLGIEQTWMLTGDDEAAARAIAARAGVDCFDAELLPGEKVEAVKHLTDRYRRVVMIGDGINDAPALAASSVGIALGAHGAAVAAETADIVLTTDDVDRVGDAVEIGQRTLKIAKQSIWIGLGVSGALMIIAAFGYIPPAVGAILQEGLDVGVILNALRARS